MQSQKDAVASKRNSLYVSVIFNLKGEDGNPLHHTICFLGDHWITGEDWSSEEEEASLERPPASLERLFSFVDSFPKNARWLVGEKCWVGPKNDVEAVEIRAADEDLMSRIIAFQKECVLPGHISDGSWRPHITSKGQTEKLISVGELISTRVELKVLETKQVLSSNA